MKKFEEQKFEIPELKGLSKKTLDEHLKLYAGYVKNANLILDHIEELSKDAEKFGYELGELHRRFAFEFGGVRNHELYFSSFEGGPKPVPDESPLEKAIVDEWGDFETWLNLFKKVAATTRGIGWTMLYYDENADRLLNAWVDEQHLNHPVGLKPVLGLDMWEHAYIMDYAPSGKKNYVEDFFGNLNWQKIENNFTQAKSK